MASLGSLVASIRVDVGSAIADVNAVAVAIQKSLSGALATVGKSLDVGQITGLETAVQKAATSMGGVATQAAKVNVEVGRTTGMIETWDDFLKVAQAEYKRLNTLANQYADTTGRSLRAQEQLNRATAFRGPAETVAPVSIRSPLTAVMRDPATGRFFDSIQTQVDKIVAKWNSMNGVVQLVNGELVRTNTLTDHLNARFKAMDAALLGVKVNAQGLGGYLRVSVEPLERIARSAQRVGHNLNVASISANRLKKSLDEGTKAAKNLNSVDMRKLSSEFLNLAAIMAPGRAGTVIYGMGALVRIAGLGKGAIGGLSVGLGVLAAGAIVAGAAVAGVVGAITNLISTGVSGAATVENLLISFEALTGSAEAAHSEIQALVDLAVKSPFKLDTLLDLDRMLLSQGVKDGLMRGKLVKAINDIGSAFGRTDADIQNLGRAVAQVFGRGYLSGDELRQLYNQMIPIWDLLRTLPGFTDAAQSQLRKLSEQQQISAEDMALAFELFASDLAKAAEMQAQSLTGMKQRIAELREARLGLAFLQVEDTHLGPLEAIRNTLLPIIEKLESLDFRPLAASIGALFGALFGPIQGLARDTEWLRQLFQVWLPQAISFLAIIIQEFAQGIQGIPDLFASIWNVVKQVAPAIGIAFAIGLGLVITAINQVIAAFALMYAAIGTVIGIFRVFFAFVTGGDATGAINDTFDALKGGVAAFGNFATAGTSATQSILDAVASIQALDIDVKKFGKEAPPIFADGEDGLENVAEAAEGAAGAVDNLNEEMNELWELTRRLFGQRSELEEGLLGDEGFEATVDSIVRMGQRLIEIFEKIGDQNVTSIIRNATYQLINLAKRREDAAERLKNAEEALAEAIRARDEFANGLRETALSFANALNLEEQTEQRWRHVAAQGFFVVEEIKAQESFTEALKRRLKAMREFFEGIQALRGRGLDPDLLASLFAAGPEQAGDIVKGLVEGGAAAISETNALQAQIKTLADQMAAYGATQWHKVGVAEAQALVDGIKGELKVIEASAIEVAELVYQTVLPYAKKMKDLGEEATGGAGGLAGGLAGGIPGLEGAMGDVGTVWDEYHGGLQEKAQKSGETLMDPAQSELTGFLGDLQASLTTVNELVNGDGGMVETIQTSLEGIRIDIIKWFPTGEEARDKVVDWIQRNIVRWLPFGAFFQDESDRQFNLPDSEDPFGQDSAELSAAPQVNVFIGDQELRGMVRTEMVVQEVDNAVRVVRGRR